MKTFKNYLYGDYDFRAYGLVRHDKKLNQSFITDGRFIVISKELFDSSKDVEVLKKTKKNKEFDIHTLNYTKLIYPKEDLEEFDFEKFKNYVEKYDTDNFTTDVDFKELCCDKLYFKDEGFDFVLPLTVIHNINIFINDNKNRIMKVYANKEDRTKNLMIEVYSDDILNDEILNIMIFMPIATNHEYNAVAENGEIKFESGTYLKNIENKYSWSDMANEFTNRGIPHSVVANMADVQSAWIYNRPIMSIFKFDDWLHEKFGDYESEKKSMHDMFIQLFDNDCDKMAYYFGIENKKEDK